jgi:hypothetical protein
MKISKPSFWFCTIFRMNQLSIASTFEVLMHFVVELLYSSSTCRQAQIQHCKNVSPIPLPAHRAKQMEKEIRGIYSVSFLNVPSLVGLINKESYNLRLDPRSVNEICDL